MVLSVRSAIFFPICMLIFLFSCDNLWVEEHVFYYEVVETNAEDVAEVVEETENFPIVDKEETTDRLNEEQEPLFEAAKASYLMDVTAYNATVEQCGKADGITASGTYVTEGRTIACNDFPFGTKLLIGENVYVVEDRCGYDNVIDIYFDDYDDAMSWGRRTMEVTVVE